MMEGWQLRIQIEAMAIMAVVEGMKAENIDRERKNQAQAYGEAAFFDLAEDLNIKANQLRHKNPTYGE